MAQVQAVSTAAFCASLGVNVHLADNAGPYGDLPMLETELKYLGINQIRDNQPYSWNVGAYETLAAAGIKMDLIIGHNPNEAMSTADLQSDLALINQVAIADRGSIIGLEGLNEPYNFPNTWNGQPTNNWTVVEQVQAAEYALVQADPQLAGLPLLSTSTDPNSFPGATPPDLASMASFGNAHVYPYQGDQPPFVMNNILSGQSTIVPGKPSWITEFGYSTAYEDPNYGADQATQAKNTLNGLLEAFQSGVPKTFLYQLNDEIADPSPTDVQDNWGLFNSDGTEKLAATAIHDLTSILADTGANAQNFTPGSIDYTISNLPSTGDSMLMEKSNGTFDLAVWNDAVDWNATTNTEVTVSPTTVTVALGSTYANISVFDPMVGTSAIASYNNASSVQIQLTDHPLIIQLSGGSATPAPKPSSSGTKITTAGPSITDQSGTIWTLVQSATQGLQIAVNGIVDSVTSNVKLLEYLNGAIVQENTSGNWYSEPGSAGPWTQISAPATPSPSGTVIKSTSAAPIIDASGHSLTLVQSATEGLQIAVNGVVDAVTSNVTLLEYLNGAIVQENTSGNWYSEPGSAGPWTQISAPVTPSPSGTVIKSTSAAPIIDASGNSWTLVQSTTEGLQIAVNGIVDAVTSNVVLLEYLNGAIVQENSSSNWYSEPAASGPWTQIAAPAASTAAPPASPNGTKITTAGKASIVDQSGNVWTLMQSATQGLRVAVNGVVDATTTNVKMLEYLNGAMVQENTGGNWYSEPGPLGPWQQIAAITPSIGVTAIATGQAYTVSGTKAATTTDAGTKIVITSSGAATVSVGATSDKLQFIAMSSVSVTAGTAASQVVADGGKNTFTAGAAPISVTGGAGADAYVYHAGDALLTIQDFSTAKGDTLTIDKSLQSAMTETPDGSGGVILGFGTAGKGIDIRDMASIPSSQLHFT